jgi:hypothetical protein
MLASRRDLKADGLPPLHRKSRGDALLNPKPQPARPDKIKIKGDLEQHLVRLACSDPPEGRSHWTLQLLADELVVLGLVDSLSIETIRHALKKRHASLDSGNVVYPTPS